MRRLGPIAAAALLFACGSSETEPPADEEAEERVEAEPEAEAEEAPPEIPEPSALQGLMRGHYRSTAEARDALIRGDVEAARERMQWLADHEEADSLPEDLRPRLALLQTEAAAFGEATTLTEAGQAHARTLVRCGQCHEASGGGFTPPEPPPLPQGDDTASHMQRHRWAAERMWEGLVTAQVERYATGVAALEEAPLHGELPAAQEPPDRVAAIAAHVHELGEQAEAAEDWDARAAVYGRFLATCATCHRLVGVGPEAPVEPVLEE